MGAGASFPATLYQALGFVFSSEYPHLALSYTALGSGKGKCRVVGNCADNDTDFPAPAEVDFAGSDSIHTEADYEYVVAADGQLQMYPAVAGAVVAIFNLPGVSELTLPPDVVADIFRQCSDEAVCAPPSWISRWDDVRILAANPAVPPANLQGPIRVVVRQESSGTTEIWKQSLGMLSPAFAGQLEGHLTDSAVWPNVSVVYARDNHGVASIVLDTPGAIGYVSLQEAITSGNTYAGMGKSVLGQDGVLRATSKSVMYALTEKGFAFGNNGDVPAHLTAAVMGAAGSEAWPAAGFTYFSMRNDNDDGDGDCTQRRALLQWLEWFYQSASVDAIAESFGFVPLPSEGKSFVLGKIRANLRCNGQLVYTANSSDEFAVAMPAESRTVAVSVAVNAELASTFLLYAQSYAAGSKGMAKVVVKEIASVADLTPSLSRTVDDDNDDNSTRAVTAAVQLYVLGWEDSQQLIRQQPSVAPRVFVPFAAVPWGVVYNFCEGSGKTPTCDNTAQLDLVLSLDVVRQMLKGEVQWWNATEIQALQTSDAQRALLPQAKIEFVGYDAGAREPDVFLRLMAMRGVHLSKEDFVVATTNAGTSRTFQQASRRVFANRFSFTFGPVNVRLLNTNARVARLVSSNGGSGTVVSATAGNLKACVHHAQQQQQLQEQQQTDVFARYNLTSNLAAECWPLTTAHFLSLPAAFSGAQCGTRAPQEATWFAASLLQTRQQQQARTRTLLQDGNDPLESLGFASLVESELAFDSLACYGRSIVRPTVDPQLVPVALTLVAQVVAALIMAFSAGMLMWIKYHRQHGVIRASTPPFLYQMCFGFMLELLAVFALSAQDDGSTLGLESDLDLACMTAPWLYCFGFALVYAGLLVKTWRIHMLFNNPKLQKRFITNWHLFRIQLVVVLLPLFAVLLAWTLTDPLVWRREVSTLDPTTGDVVATMGGCVGANQGGGAMYFLGSIIAFGAVLLLAGLVLAWKNRQAPTDFSEGRYVSAAIMTDSELLIIAVPLLVIVSTNSIASYTVKVLFIMLSVVSTIAIFFYPKFAVVHGYWEAESSFSQQQQNRYKNSSKQQVKQGGGGLGSPKHGPQSPFSSADANKHHASFYTTNHHLPQQQHQPRPSSSSRPNSPVPSTSTLYGGGGGGKMVARFASALSSSNVSNLGVGGIGAGKREEPAMSSSLYNAGSIFAMMEGDYNSHGTTTPDNVTPPGFPTSPALTSVSDLFLIVKHHERSDGGGGQVSTGEV